MRVLTIDTNQPPASTPCARNAPALSSPPAPSPSKPCPRSARSAISSAKPIPAEIELTSNLLAVENLAYH